MRVAREQNGGEGYRKWGGNVPFDTTVGIMAIKVDKVWTICLTGLFYIGIFSENWNQLRGNNLLFI